MIKVLDRVYAWDNILFADDTGYRDHPNGNDMFYMPATVVRIHIASDNLLLYDVFFHHSNRFSQSHFPSAVRELEVK